LDEQRDLERDDERSRADELAELRERVAVYEDIIRSLPFGLIFIDEEDRVSLCNPIAETVRGAGKRLGRDVQGCHPQRTHRSLERVLERFRSGDPEEHHPLVMERRNRYEVTYARVARPDGAYRGVLWLSTDISRRKQLERELRHAERLIGLGRMAAKLAHDIKNPLNAIQGAAHYLGETASEPEAAELTDLIKDEVRGITDLLGQLRELTKPQHPELQPTDIHAALEEHLRQARVTYPDVDLQLVCRCHGIGEIPCDPRLLSRLLDNATANACAAMNGWGAITFRTGVRTHSDGEWFVIEIEDTGPGFSDEVLEHLFEPFLTTREDGTGIGLTIMREICYLHGGDLTVESTDHGARVTATLSTR
jgi:PAS domain S-box-containing protein